VPEESDVKDVESLCNVEPNNVITTLLMRLVVPLERFPEWKVGETRWVRLSQAGNTRVLFKAGPECGIVPRALFLAHGHVLRVGGDVTTLMFDLIATVQATGGLEESGAPVGDPEWLDVGDVYMRACACMGLECVQA
jgi:hypothetical protein